MTTTNASQPIIGPEERPARNLLPVRLGALRDLLAGNMIDGENRRRAVKAAQEAVDAADHLAAVKELHQARPEEVLPFDCADGGCDHEEAARGEDCPTVTISVCAECFGLIWDTDPEHYVPSAAQWPCATAKAFGTVA